MNFEKLNRIILSLLLVGALLSVFNWVSPWLIIGFIFGYGSFILFISMNLQLNFFVQAFNNNPNEIDNRVAITFDDGPGPHTLEILKILEKYRVKASFFCIGKNIEEHPDILNLIIDQGHFVGNHSYTHTLKMGFLSADQIVEELKNCDRAFKKAAGIVPGTYRPPFGVMNPQISRALKQTGHKVIGWNLRSYDAVLKSRESIIKRVTRKLAPGDVILLHDTKEHTAEILEQLLLFLQNNNYRPVRVDKLFEIDAYS